MDFLVIIIDLLLALGIVAGIRQQCSKHQVSTQEARIPIPVVDRPNPRNR